MAASYQTGLTTSPIDFLNTLGAWLVAQGWTQQSLINEGTGRRGHYSKGGMFLNFRAANNETGIWPSTNVGQYQNVAGYGLAMNVSSAYSGASAWHAQTGNPQHNGGANGVGVGMRLVSGNIVGYHFFDDGFDNITVVAEIVPGYFTHLGWGPALVRRGYTWDSWYFFGSQTGFYTMTNPGTAGVWGFYPQANAGPPFCGLGESPSNGPPNSVLQSNANGYVRLDASLFANRWGSNYMGADGTTGNTAQSAGYTGRRLFAARHLFSDFSPAPAYEYGGNPANEATVFGPARLLHNSAFQRSLIVPQHIYMFQPSVARWVALGYLPTVFPCNALDEFGLGFAVGQVISVGGLDYKLFPRFAVLKAA